MGGAWLDIVWAVAAALLCVTLAALVARVARARGFPPLARLATALVVTGCAALGVSALIAALGIAVAPTPRFYHGMLTGVGVGALVGALVLMWLIWLEGR